MLDDHLNILEAPVHSVEQTEARTCVANSPILAPSHQLQNKPHDSKKRRTRAREQFSAGTLHITISRLYARADSCDARENPFENHPD